MVNFEPMPVKVHPPASAISSGTAPSGDLSSTRHYRFSDSEHTLVPDGRAASHVPSTRKHPADRDDIVRGETEPPVPKKRRTFDRSAMSNRSAHELSDEFPDTIPSSRGPPKPVPTRLVPEVFIPFPPVVHWDIDRARVDQRRDRPEKSTLPPSALSKGPSSGSARPSVPAAGVVNGSARPASKVKNVSSAVAKSHVSKPVPVNPIPVDSSDEDTAPTGFDPFVLTGARVSHFPRSYRPVLANFSPRLLTIGRRALGAIVWIFPAPARKMDHATDARVVKSPAIGRRSFTARTARASLPFFSAWTRSRFIFTVSARLFVVSPAGCAMKPRVFEASAVPILMVLHGATCLRGCLATTPP